MANALCNICTEYYPIEALLFAFCGHPLCSDCLQLMVKPSEDGQLKLHCPVCRASLMAGGGPHHVYPQFSDSNVQEHVAHIASRINRFEVDAQPASLEKGAQKLRRIANKVALKPAESRELLDAAKKMDTVMKDMAGKIEDLQRRKDELEEELEITKAERSNLASRCDVLSRDAKLFHKYREENVALSQELENLREFLERSTAQRNGLKQENTKLEQEKERLRMQLKAEKQRTKAMAKQKKQLQSKDVDEEEDSLIIVG
ncbi:hypothetical protein FA15DRAFT_668084 [Coprinopsis marcescibilis]|uniref:RING-type domain-containing protein n=1 Tax=Coprinopsis marcescibilis TaxID=230819 RepID=A0A5C3KYT7_COPMA|nr:hypothetical protein FA15DRAFT_668084 [Coprinopsis marcescibilis]